MATVPSSQYFIVHYPMSNVQCPMSNVQCPMSNVHQGRVEDAEKVLKWLRGPGFDVTPELQALKKAQVCLKNNWNDT